MAMLTHHTPAPLALRACRYAWRRVRLQWLIHLQEPVVAIGDTKLRIGRHMSAALRDVCYRGRYEAAEMQTIGTHLQPDDVVMELGGGIGFISSFCAGRIGSERVFCYEANPALETHIRETYRLNGVSPRLSMCLLADAPGEVRFYLDESFTSSSTIPSRPGAPSVLVPVKPINAEIRRVRPTFLILDIEGGEYDLCRIIDFATIRKIAIELHPAVLGAAKTQAVQDRLAEAGFAVIERFPDAKVEVLYLERRNDGRTGDAAS